MEQLTESVAKHISIHAPREGGDLTGRTRRHTPYNFNPRPPRGGRRHDGSRVLYDKQFQSTPPARGATFSV